MFSLNLRQVVLCLLELNLFVLHGRQPLDKPLRVGNHDPAACQALKGFALASRNQGRGQEPWSDNFASPKYPSREPKAKLREIAQISIDGNSFYPKG